MILAKSLKNQSWNILFFPKIKYLDPKPNLSFFLVWVKFVPVLALNLKAAWPALCFGVIWIFVAQKMRVFVQKNTFLLMSVMGRSISEKSVYKQPILNGHAL
jgi:hypothetical protein